MKNRWLRLALYFSAAVIAVSLLAASGFYREIHRTNHQTYDPTKDPLRVISDSTTPVEPAAIRAACHEVLLIGNGDRHDAFLMLQTYGDKTSIPLLIRALRREAPPNEDGSMICTTGHCIEALCKLTGQDFGYDPEKWQAWWDQHRLESMPVKTP